MYINKISIKASKQVKENVIILRQTMKTGRVRAYFKSKHLFSELDMLVSVLYSSL